MVEIKTQSQMCVSLKLPYFFLNVVFTENLNCDSKKVDEI